MSRYRRRAQFVTVLNAHQAESRETSERLPRPNDAGIAVAPAYTGRYTVSAGTAKPIHATPPTSAGSHDRPWQT